MGLIELIVTVCALRYLVSAKISIFRSWLTCRSISAS